MRAVLLDDYGPAELLRLGEAPEPTLRSDDLLIDVHATSINPVDTKIRAGYQRAIVGVRFPQILGMDVSGVVAAVGDRVKGFAVGDEVFASPSHRRMGCWAERVAVRASEVAPKPRTVDHVGAASLPLVGLTAWDALVRHGKLRAGQRVLIQAGAGGVGTFTIQLAKHLGAEVLTTCSARNFELVRSLGADRAIDHASEDYEVIAKDVDLIVDCLGREHLPRALRTVRRGGRVIALTTGLPEAAKKCGPWLGAGSVFANLGAFTARCLITKNVAFKPMARRTDGAALGELGALVDQGVIRPVIDRELPLDAIIEANHLIEGGRSRGKVVLRVR